MSPIKEYVQVKDIDQIQNGIFEANYQYTQYIKKHANDTNATKTRFDFYKEHGVATDSINRIIAIYSHKHHRHQFVIITDGKHDFLHCPRISLNYPLEEEI